MISSKLKPQFFYKNKFKNLFKEPACILSYKKLSMIADTLYFVLSFNKNPYVLQIYIDL